MAKKLNGRFVQKHDIEANWLKATGFIPMLGEAIVYDPDETYLYSRLKVGDGVTNVNDLPFADVQPDWSQNDENAADYIKNRTHYKEITNINILPETAMTLNSSEEGMTFHMYASAVDQQPVIGQVYTVNYNGTDYECQAIEYTEDSATFILMGYTEPLGMVFNGQNADAPFMLMIVPPDMVENAGAGMACYSWDAAEAVTISISYSGEVVHKIGAEYLPAYDWNAEEGDEGYIANRTHWTTTKPTEILPEIEVDTTNDGGNVYRLITNAPSVGGTCTVNWNGTDYECVAENFSNDSWSGYMFGRTKTFGGTSSTGDFFIVVSDQILATTDDGKAVYGMVMAYANEATPNVISIMQPAGTVFPLDEKYVPTSIARLNNIPYPVTSVNDKTGDVVLNASDVGAYTRAATDTKIESAKNYAKSVVKELNISNDAQYALKQKTCNAEGYCSTALGRNTYTRGTASFAEGSGHFDNLGWAISGEPGAATYSYSSTSGILPEVGDRIQLQTYDAVGIILQVDSTETGGTITVDHCLYANGLVDEPVWRVKGGASLGYSSHSQGDMTIAGGYASHSQGYGTSANARYSSASGCRTIAGTQSSTVLGEYNLPEGIVNYWERSEMREFTVTYTFKTDSTYYLLSGTPRFDGIKGSFYFDGSSAITDLSSLSAGSKICEGSGLAVVHYYEIISFVEAVDGGYSYKAISRVVGDLDLSRGKYVQIVGNGTGPGDYRSNAYALDWDGNAYHTGDVYVQGDGTNIGFEGAKKLATEEYVDTKAPLASEPLKQLVSDENGDTVWEDRLAYKTTGTVEVLAETELTVDEDQQVLIATPWIIVPQAGNVYTINFNGKAYDCEAFACTIDGPPSGTVVLGKADYLANFGIDGGSTDAPFYGMFFPSEVDGVYGVLFPEDASLTTVTLSITGEVTTIKKLDTDYLPDGVGKQIVLTIDADGNVTTDTTFAEAWKLTAAQLHAAVTIKETPDSYHGECFTAADKVSKSTSNGWGENIFIEIRQPWIDTSDTNDEDTTRYLKWNAAGVVIFNNITPGMPVMQQSDNWDGCYMKYTGNRWRPVTLDQLKADLGLPVPTADDAGKILRVNSEGKYELVALAEAQT